MSKLKTKKRLRVSRRPENQTDAKLKFFSDLSHGRLTLADSIRRMREITGKTQPEYAKLVGIAPRILIDLERGLGNPTKSTLEKIGRPFGLFVTFQKPQQQ